MHLPYFLAEIGPIGNTAFDDMLRMIGIAAIILACFKGVRSLIVKPAPRQPTPAPAISTPPTQPAKTHPQPADEEIAPEILVAIAAAVACFTGHSHRIISIKRQSTHWEKAGRQAVLSSHKIR